MTEIASTATVKPKNLHKPSLVTHPAPFFAGDIRKIPAKSRGSYRIMTDFVNKDFLKSVGNVKPYHGAENPPCRLSLRQSCLLKIAEKWPVDPE